MDHGRHVCVWDDALGGAGDEVLLGAGGEEFAETCQERDVTGLVVGGWELDVHIKAIDLDFLTVWTVEWSWLSIGHPSGGAWTECTPEEISKVSSLSCTVQGVGICTAAK